MSNSNSFSRGTLVALVAVVTLLVLNAALSFRNIQQLDDDARWVAHTQEVMGKSSQLLRVLVDAESGSRAYVITGREDYLERYHLAVKELPQRFTELQALTQDNASQQTRLKELRPQADARLTNLATAINLRRDNQVERARIHVAAGEGKKLMDGIRQAILNVHAEEQRLLADRGRRTRTAYLIGVTTAIAGGVLGLVMVFAFLWQLEKGLQIRQKASAAIHEQRQLLHATLVSIGDAVIATDSSGRVTFMNGVAQDLTGWSEREAQGVPLEQVFHIVNEDTRQMVENPAVRALREGAIVGLANHTILISKTGIERPIDDSAAPIRSSEGIVSGAVLVFRDVTEQRRAARQLSVGEARKTAILNSSLDCIVTIDQDGKIVEFNPAAERTFGRLRQDVVGCELAELIIPQEYRQQHREGLVRYLATGEARLLNRRMEMVALRADGTQFPVEAAIVPIEGDGAVLFTGHLRDITDRKQAEQAASERLRHATLDAEIGMALGGSWLLPEMLQVCAESLVRNLDAALARVWTYDAHDNSLEMQASAGISTRGPQWQKRVTVGQYKVGKIAQDRKPLLTNSVIGDPRLPDQEWMQQEGLVAFAGYPLLINDRLIGVMTIFARRPLSETVLGTLASAARGIALGIERKEMEDRLRQYVADLSEADRRKDEFLAVLAHELRNPLAPIRNGLQLLRMAGTHGETVEEARSMMDRQLTQMVRLVDDLMDVSRITRGKLQLRMERVLLADALNSAVETSRPLIEEMGHRLTVHVPSEPLFVEADPTRLSQVFLNLLNNAAKYTDRGGQITLRAERQGSDAVVTISDTGIGIAADQLPRIFGMFSQIDRSLEKSQGGLGIGLTLVKRLIEKHGGSVEAQSPGLGQGSTFTVRVPLILASQPKPPPLPSEPVKLKGSLKILIVDDNRDGADSLGMMLRMLGNTIQTAYDGEQGLLMAAEFRPDVILLDIGLPKLNGYEACRRIRQEPWGTKTLLIAVTGWGQEDDRRRSQEAGFDHHLVKPVNPQELMKLLAARPVGETA